MNGLDTGDEVGDVTSKGTGRASRDVGDRVRRVRERLHEQFAASAMLVSSPANIRYLTGFTGAATGLLVLSERLVLFTDSRYRIQALRTVSSPHLSQTVVDVIPHWDRAEGVKRALPKFARLVIEADHLSMAEYATLGASLSGVELIAADDVVLEERVIKDAGEVARIKAAAAISDAAFEDLLAAEPVGWSELEIASFLLDRLVALGAERGAFEPIAASGPRSGLAHTRPSRQRLEEGMVLLTDFGAEIEGYKADMTRTMWWGKAPEDLERAVGAVREAYDAAVGLLMPGVPCEAVDAAARKVLTRYGLDKYIVHPTGHNIGLEVHERPFLGSGYPGELAAGNVVTVEPGVYIRDVGGVRLEDTFVVTGSGPIALTTSGHYGSAPRRRGEERDGSPGLDFIKPDDGPHVEWDEAKFSGEYADFEKVDDHKRFLIGDHAPWVPVKREEGEARRGQGHAQPGR